MRQGVKFPAPLIRGATTLLVPCHPPPKNGAAHPGGFAMCGGPQNDGFFASSETLSERKGRRQCKMKSKELQLVISQSRNPSFSGGYQLARTTLGQFWHKGLLGLDTPFLGWFGFFSTFSARLCLHKSQHAARNISMQLISDGPRENRLGR